MSSLVPRNLLKEDDAEAPAIAVPPIRNLSVVELCVTPLKSVSIRSANLATAPESSTSPSLIANPSGYSWQKLQETIRRESKVHGIVDEEEDGADAIHELEEGEIEEDPRPPASWVRAYNSKPKSSSSMSISDVLCK